tara:strand:+ start:496 stop:774 length:279 start_codon:yes stop_codon:yes gene_type:complete
MKIFRVKWVNRPTGKMVQRLGPRGIGVEEIPEWETVRVETPIAEAELRKHDEKYIEMQILRAKKARKDAEKQIIADNDKALDAFRSTHKEVW